MELEENDDTERKIKAVLNGLVQSKQPNNSPSRDDLNIVASYRYGLSLLVIAVFTLVAGAYPLQTDAVNRVVLLGFAVLLLFIGIWNIDRALSAQRASADINKKRSD